MGRLRSRDYPGPRTVDTRWTVRASPPRRFSVWPVRSRWALPALVLLGMLILQAAWIIAVPPFRGIDEFDHAYRAAAVARGEWLAEGTPEHGRGGLVTVPPDIVRAAHAQCSALPYTGHDNCNPAQVLSGGQVRVASAASRYNPVFYWVVGTVARPFHGDAALYVMRATSALLCAIGLAVAAWLISRRTSTLWPKAGLLLAVTPVFAYSTVLPAPNGLEMVSGLVLWCALLTLGQHQRRGDGWLIGWAVGASLCLVTLRSLGPVFEILIVCCVLIVRRRQLRAIWSMHARLLTIGIALTTLVTVASVWWILVQAPLGLGGASDGSHSDASYVSSLRVLPIGLFQTVAAFPLRNERAPIFVYGVYLILVAAIFLVALRKSRGTLRQGLVLGLLLSQLVPLVLTVASIRSVGLVWQGRYGLAFVAGLTVLAGVALDRVRARSVPGPVLAATASAYLVAQVACIAAVYHRELRDSVSIADPGFLQTSTAVVGAVGLIGWLIVVGALLLSADRGGNTEPDRSREDVELPVTTS